MNTTAIRVQERPAGQCAVALSNRHFCRLPAGHSGDHEQSTRTIFEAIAAEPILAKCDVCEQEIKGYPSYLNPGTTIWLSGRSGEGYGHLHSPKAA